MLKRWIFKTIPDPDEIESLSKILNVNSILTALLLQRNIRDFDSAKRFFRPSLDHLHDPFLLKDMDLAVERLHRAISDHEHILIFGDYDVDGTTAVSLVYSYLRNFYPSCDYYIPDRNAEGYGVSEAGVLWARDSGFTLIIALDLGIKSGEMVQLARDHGIDFIICDHHLPGDIIPSAVAVLDPKRDDCQYPFDELSGCGIGFKLIQAYSKRYRPDDNLSLYLDLVAISIASDIVPIIDENRILTYFGLIQLNHNPRPGLKALKEIASIKNDLDVTGVIFTLGPRINAAGRIAHARGAVDLLISRTDAEAIVLAGKIDGDNFLRREFDSNITEEAINMIDSDTQLRKSKSTVLFKKDWHKGVIGIVAARCIEKYYRPTVILTESNNKITGSARSVRDFDLYGALCECSDLLEKFGGHKYAAGLTMDPGNLVAFRERFERVVAASLTEEMRTPVIEIDTVINFDVISSRFTKILKQMAPFGPENQKPIFCASKVSLVGVLNSFKDRHIKFMARQKGNKSEFMAVGFDMISYKENLSQAESFDMVFTIEENQFNNATSIQLHIKDINFN